MPKNALAIISPQPDSQSSDAIVRRWIVAIAELCGKELTLPLVELWCQLLADIDPGLLDRALQETAKTCGRFFPTPGEVRARIDNAEAKGIELNAEEAWECALSVAESDGRGYHTLDAATQHAIRAAGGLHWIESCPEQELQWARKRFLEDYTLIHETQQAENLLSDGNAKTIIRQLTAQSKQPRPRELSPVTAPVAAEPLTPDDPICADFAALRERLSQPEPVYVLSEAEFAARRELLGRQKDRVGIKPAEPSAPTPSEHERPTLFSHPSGAPEGLGVDVTLWASADGVSLQCRSCSYKELVLGFDREHAARQAAFRHCWSQHRVRAYWVRFQDAKALTRQSADILKREEKTA